MVGLMSCNTSHRLPFNLKDLGENIFKYQRTCVLVFNI
jgi:hypothetical protein